ncbi:UNVERIFIED_CONTAM: hypothetical protein ABID98_003498 [Brevibacillus sp. OAP136]
MLGSVLAELQGLHSFSFFEMDCFLGASEVGIRFQCDDRE